jgi:hypothetical protein
MVMKKPNKILVIIALSMIAPSAYSGSLNDGIAAGDVLSSVLLNNAKAAINDNDSRTTALEKTNNDIGNKISALEDADSVVDGKLTRLGDKDAEIDEQILRLDGLDDDYEGRLDVLEAVDNGFTTRVTNLETGTDQNTSDVGSLETEDIAISTRIGLIDDATTGTVKALRTDLVDEDDAIKDRIGLIDDATTGTVKALRTDLEGEDDAINGRLDAIDGDNGSTSSTVDQLRDRVAAIDGGKDADGASLNVNKVNVLESSMSTLVGGQTSTETGMVFANRTRINVLEGMPSVTAGAGDPPVNVNTTDYPVGSVYTDTRDGGRAYVLEQVINAVGVWRNVGQKVYTVGDVGPGGGWVFQISDGGTRGWEAGADDEGAPGFFAAFSGAVAAFGGAKDAIGATKSNTYKLVGPYMASPMANVCLYYTGGLGASDAGLEWFLPSGLMLEYMRDVLYGRVAPGGIDGFTVGAIYASSSFEADVNDTFFNVYTYLWDGTVSPMTIRAGLDFYSWRCVRPF